MSIPSLLVVLIVSPVAVFGCHICSYRLLRALGRRPTAHSSALAAIVAGLCLMLAVVGRLAPPDLGLSWLCLFAYVLAVYGALAVLYLDVVNIAETSLHMHLLLEIAWSDRPSLDRLAARYSPDRLIDQRIERLAALGQLRCVDGRYFLADRSTLRLAKGIDLWRTVLGLPTSPGQTVEP